jgi:hypothetical protein
MNPLHANLRGGAGVRWFGRGERLVSWKGGHIGSPPFYLVAPPPFFFSIRLLLFYDSYLVDPASSHMLVSKIKPCMSKYKLFIR